MADQFCRIVDTTMCDMTLGSDASQVILTTDANTSYVIRDVFKTDSDADTTSLSFQGQLVMDGHPVVSNLNTSAGGSLIVPPSTTVCYKDTSGNYPLSITSLEIQSYGFNGTNCCCSHIGRKACAVNGTIDGAFTQSNTCYPTNTGICLMCECQGQYLSFQWHDCSGNNYFRVGTDGNSNNSLVLHCLTPDYTTCLTLVMCYSTGYCSVALNGNNVASVTESDVIRFWSPSFCGGLCCCHRALCLSFLGSSYYTAGMTTYSRSGISSKGSKPGTTSCYGWIKFPGGAATSAITWGHVDIDCAPDYYICQAGGVGIIIPSQYASTNLCSKGYSSCARYGVYYSLCEEQWLGWFWEGATITFLKPDNSITEHCLSAAKYFSCSVSDDGRNFWLLKSCECKSQYADLDDLYTNGDGASWTTFEDYGSSGTNCWKAYGPNCCCNMAWVVKNEIDTSAKSCDRGIDPTSKLTAYGIKST